MNTSTHPFEIRIIHTARSINPYLAHEKCGVNCQQQVRKDPTAHRGDRDRERGVDPTYRDRNEFRERETGDRDWGRLRRVPGPPPGVHGGGGGGGGGMRGGGGGDGDRRREGSGVGGLERLERHPSL